MTPASVSIPFFVYFVSFLGYNSPLMTLVSVPISLFFFFLLFRQLSGALTGLTRVRRFCQDDAHVFCREDQIKQEVLGALQFMKHVYDIFGMSYKV